MPKCSGFRCAVTPDGKTVVAVENGDAVRVWDLHSGKERRLLKRGNGFALALAPDAKTLLGGKGVALLDIDTGENTRTLGAGRIDARPDTVSNSLPSSAIAERGFFAPLAHLFRILSLTNHGGTLHNSRYGFGADVPARCGW